MKRFPLPSELYVDFEKTATVFKQRLNGDSLSDVCKQFELSPVEASKRINRLGNHLIYNWKTAVKQGSSDPTPIASSISLGNAAPVYYFLSISKARKDKAFWLLQLDREKTHYDKQRTEEQSHLKPINVVQLGLKYPTANWLAQIEIYTVEQLLALSDRDFVKLSGIGEVKRREIRAALFKHKLFGLTDKEQLEKASIDCWVGLNADGSLDLIGSEGKPKTIQLDGSFTHQQLEQLVILMKEKEKETIPQLKGKLN